MRELEVTNLAVMQSGYRLPVKSMRQLMTDVQQGTVFDRQSLLNRDARHAKLIAITRFEDGYMAIRDGVHRATAIQQMRPSGKLHPQEYVIEEMTYDMFLQPNLEVGFLTPFDPRTEVRVADWSEFRREVSERIEAGRDPLAYIASHRHAYTRPRESYHDSLSKFSRYWSKHSGVLS